jgi:hypothetical protein
LPNGHLGGSRKSGSMRPPPLQASALGGGYNGAAPLASPVTMLTKPVCGAEGATAIGVKQEGG